MKPMITKSNGRCDAIADALRAEVGGLLAERIIDGEAADFMWESRVRERYLGQHLDPLCGDDAVRGDVSRIAVLSIFDRKWRVGICLVDGEGAVMNLLWKRCFLSDEEAEIAFARVR